MLESMNQRNFQKLIAMLLFFLMIKMIYTKFNKSNRKYISLNY